MREKENWNQLQQRVDFLLWEHLIFHFLFATENFVVIQYFIIHEKKEECRSVCTSLFLEEVNLPLDDVVDVFVLLLPFFDSLFFDLWLDFFSLPLWEGEELAVVVVGVSFLEVDEEWVWGDDLFFFSSVPFSSFFFSSVFLCEVFFPSSLESLFFLALSFFFVFESFFFGSLSLLMERLSYTHNHTITLRISISSFDLYIIEFLRNENDNSKGHMYILFWGSVVINHVIR